MKRLMTAAEAAALERYTTETAGVPSAALTERAALALARECEKAAGVRGKILCVCGPGKAGAAGAAAARILRLRGYGSAVALAAEEEALSPELRVQLSAAENLGVPVCKGNVPDEYIMAGGWPVIADALSGTDPDGLPEDVRARFAGLISGSGAYVVAAEMPSGVSADTGQIFGTAVKAGVTVAFGCEKPGMLLYPGTEFCGRRVTADTGLAREAYEASRPQPERRLFVCGREDLERLPARPARAHKGTFGRVLVIAGSRQMGGAALFAGMAAYRMGAGLVEIATVEENHVFLQESLPEAILTVYDPEGEPDGWLIPALARAKAVTAGPGMGTEPCAEKILNLLLERCDVPLVLDADALNLLAAAGLSRRLPRRTAVTPHPGEMARLTGRTVEEIRRDPVGTAAGFARETGAVCVLKDARTVTAAPDGRVCLNASGNCGMATGGTGDLLAGMIGALFAAGAETFEGAWLGAYLHGLYGDLARDRYGDRAMIASDMGRIIGEALT